MEVRNADILADRRGSVADSKVMTAERDILKGQGNYRSVRRFIKT
jgi:hypothetical protein